MTKLVLAGARVVGVVSHDRPQRPLAEVYEMLEFGIPPGAPCANAFVSFFMDRNRVSILPVYPRRGAYAVRDPGHEGADDPAREYDGDVATAPKQRIQIPRRFRVLLHNDDYTTMEFVVMVLMTAFYHPEPEAVRIMLQIHERGVGVAGVYSYEVAESRMEKVMRMARENEFPLRCTLEPE